MKIVIKGEIDAPEFIPVEIIIDLDLNFYFSVTHEKNYSIIEYNNQEFFLKTESLEFEIHL